MGMKKWFSILVLMLTVAIALTDSGKCVPLRHPEVPIAVLSQAEDPVVLPEETPLLATAATGSSHLCSTGYITLKSSRSSEETHVSHDRHNGAEDMIATPRPGRTVYRTYLPYTRAADHYIYFLRKIII